MPFGKSTLVFVDIERLITQVNWASLPTDRRKLMETVSQAQKKSRVGSSRSSVSSTLQCLEFNV